MEESIGKLINYIGSLGPYAQVGAGSASGWIVGLSIIKIGRLAVAILGGAIILIKIAEIEHMIHIDWAQMQQNARNISTKNFNSTFLPSTGEIPSKIHNFVITFIGGFLIGIGCA